MDLSDALDGWSGSAQSGGQQQNSPWPGQQPNNPAWPGQPASGPTWPGGLAGPGGQPSSGPTWPGGPGCPPGSNPAGSGGQWPPPGGNPGQPTWPSPQPSAPGGWPAAAPQQSLMVPYNLSLPNGVHDKLMIVIAGCINSNAQKFTVDLCSGNDVAFHFNPRFNENGKRVIVRNNCIGDKWGREERDLQNFPFTPGQTFEMKILCTTTGFKVAVNNNHLLEFNHRHSNLRSITKLCIYYDLSLSKVQMETLP